MGLTISDLLFKGAASLTTSEGVLLSAEIQWGHIPHCLLQERCCLLRFKGAAFLTALL